MIWLIAALHVVCPLLFFTNLTRNPYFTQISLLQGGLCAALALWVFLSFRQKKWTIQRTPLLLPLAVLTAVCLLSWALSWLRMPPFRVAIWYEGFRNTYFWVVNCLIAFWIALHMGESGWDKRLTNLIFLTAAVAAGYGIIQYAGHDVIWPKSLNPYSGRPVSTFGNPNFLSSHLVMLLPWVVAESFREEKPWRLWFLRICFLLYVSALICTMTRSSWLGAAAALGLFFVWSRRLGTVWPRAWKVLIAAGLALVFFWPGSPLSTQKTKPWERMRELAQGISSKKAYGSWHQRLMIWSCAWDMARAHPVIGKGWGTFELFYPFYQGWYLADTIFKNFRTHANNAHNVILEYWAQIGTLGLAAYLWVFVTTAFIVWRRRKSLPPERALRAAALTSALLGMGVDNFFGNVSLFFAVPAFLFWWLAGRLAWDLGAGNEERTYTVTAPGWAAGAVIILLCAGGAWRAYAQWKAEVHYFAGFKAAKSNNIKAAIAETEASARWRRREVNNNYEMGNAWARQARWAQERGLTHELRSASQSAIRAYSDALAANAGYDEIYFNRGTVYAQQDSTGLAVLDYRVSLLINPISYESYKALGNLYLSNEQRWPDAADLFERGVFYFPREKDFWNNLGFLYTKAGKHQEAFDAFVKAIEIDVTFEVAWQNVRLALNELKRSDADLLAVPGLWNEIGPAMRAGQWDKTRALSEKILKLLPQNGQARLMRANAEFMQGNYAAALPDYDQVLVWEPSQWDARLNKAKTLIQLNRRGEAKEILSTLAAEQPKNEEVTTLLKAL